MRKDTPKLLLKSVKQQPINYSNNCTILYFSDIDMIRLNIRHHQVKMVQIHVSEVHILVRL